MLEQNKLLLLLASSDCVSPAMQTRARSELQDNLAVASVWAQGVHLAREAVGKKENASNGIARENSRQESGGEKARI
jgi:hypothetical protein